MIHEQRKEANNDVRRSDITELVDEINNINSNDEPCSISIFKAINNCFFKGQYSILKIKEKPKHRRFFIECSEKK